MLLRFCDAGIIELLLVIASNSNEPDSAEWNVIVLEVLYYLLQGVPVKDIFESDLKGKVSSLDHLCGWGVELMTLCIGQKCEHDIGQGVCIVTCGDGEETGPNSECTYTPSTIRRHLCYQIMGKRSWRRRRPLDMWLMWCIKIFRMVKRGSRTNKMQHLHLYQPSWIAPRSQIVEVSNGRNG